MKRLCATCAHDGQCDGLPYCDGRYYERYSDEEEDTPDEDNEDDEEDEENETRDEPRPGYGDDAIARIKENMP